MRGRIAKICLVVAVVLFLAGTLMLCYCPEWYAAASVFSGLALWLGNSSIRPWAAFWLAACLAFTALHAYAKLHEHRHVLELQQR